MAAVQQQPVSSPVAPAVPATEVADPAPLGLAGFALTTFVLSVVNAGWTDRAAGIEWIGLAFFYGGLAQFCAGMWEFKNRNTFGATAFSTYGAFWLSLAFYVFFLAARSSNANQDLGFFVLAFAVFNTYMMFWSTAVSKSVFLVFLTLEVTEILLFAGYFSKSTEVVKIGGYLGIATAASAWYASAAGVINARAKRPVLPTGVPFWVP